VKRELSKGLFQRASRVIPGGVNSPVRASRSVGAEPTFVARGHGCKITSADGDEYIDTVCSYGPLILGHAHPEVLGAVQEAMSHGTSFGAPTELEVRFAEAITEALPSIEKLRAVSSGTEATMTALRVARGFTGRPKVIKAEGGYHGHADFLLVAAGSGAATLGIPGSAGVPAGVARDTITVPYNDVDAARAALEANAGEVAAIIVEPVAGNMGVVPPAAGYLQGLRELTREHGALLIFDEVITGFRVSFGGAQAHYGVEPDLTCLGKIIGGGLPAAAFGGKAEIMDKLAPDGDVYQAGTLAGNPLAMAAGIKTLEILERPGTYERLEALGARLEQGLASAARAAGVPLTINRSGSVLTPFFCADPVTDYESAKQADTERFARFYRGMLGRGVHLAPSQFEGMFLSLAHGEAEIDTITEAAAETMGSLD
jgi:glutamate-1-semialdehyde 2,1-aminomutase